MTNPKGKCQVVGCQDVAVVKCEAGFRYCKLHARRHGEPGKWHRFKKLPVIVADKITLSLVDFING